MYKWVLIYDTASFNLALYEWYSSKRAREALVIKNLLVFGEI